MKLIYLDTSAAMKLVVEERESNALQSYIEAQSDTALVSSWLLYTEMFCTAGRVPGLIPDDTVREVLDIVELVDLTRRDLISASRRTPLRSQNAIHLAVAARLQADEILSYDAELNQAASHAGIPSRSPGR